MAVSIRCCRVLVGIDAALRCTTSQPKVYHRLTCCTGAASQSSPATLTRSPMLRRIYFILGIIAHGMFLLVFAYMAGFVGNFLVPRTIDSPAHAGGSIPAAVTVNLLLLLAFSLPHSIMARPTFKRWWTQFVPQPIERTV